MAAAAAALHRSPALLRRRHLLAGPHLFSSRKEPQILLPPCSAAANASLPSPRPTPPVRRFSSMHTHCPPPSLSFLSSSRHHPPPRHAHPAPCIPPLRGHWADDGSQTVLLVVAVEAGRGALSAGVRAGEGGAPEINVLGCRRVIFSHHPLITRVQRRLFSSSEPQGAPSEPQSAPAVASLLNLEDPELVKEEWMDPLEFFHKYPPLQDLRLNPLNLEIPGFADKPNYHFSEIGISVLHCMIYLALVNNNRDYCVKDSFARDNISISPRLRQIRFKKLCYALLNAASEDFDRAASYAAAAAFMEEMLEKVYGANVMSHLCVEATDLFNKMFRPSDECLIVFHTSLLSTNARAWMYERIYQVMFHILPLSDRMDDKVKMRSALSGMAYTAASANLKIEDIISTHPLLIHIDKSAAPMEGMHRAHLSDSSPPGSVKAKPLHDLKTIRRGKKVVALCRHTIQYAFDRGSRQVTSLKVNSAKLIWPYSVEQVVGLLKAILPLHLLKAQEAFLVHNLWPLLCMENFWARDLVWMGKVPQPTQHEREAIAKMSYRKRRAKAKKLGRPPRREKHDPGTSTLGKVDDAQLEEEKK